MSIVCSCCHGLVIANDAGRNAFVAVCPACGHAFLVERPAQSVTPPTPPTALAVQCKFSVTEPAPGRQTSTYRDAYVAPSDELVIERHWYSGISPFLIAFCVFWGGLRLAWYSSQHLSLDDIFVLPHLAIGIGIACVTFVKTFNRALLRATSRELSIDLSPLPWCSKRLVVPSRDVKEVYCENAALSHDLRFSNVRGKTTRRGYRVCASLHDGRRLTLNAGLDRPDEALFIVSHLKERLEIADARVAG